MENFYRDNDDLKFYVEKWIDWEPLVRLTEFDFKTKDGHENLDEALEFYESVLDLLGEYSAKEIAPHARAIDENHPAFDDKKNVVFPEPLKHIAEGLDELEVHGMCVPRSLGGMNCPFTLMLAGIELISRGDVSVSAHFGFHGGMAMASLLMSIMEGTSEFDTETLDIRDTRFKKMIQEIMSGKAWGSMDITEPGAGSDMAAIRTKGVQDDKGDWFVTGEKIFITSGHAKYHYVIARTEESKSDDAFAGLKGLSMFLVPTYEEEGGERKYLASFEKLEEKLGHHGSATVTVSYDNSPAQLVGERGEGFKYMLLLMNNARVAVGFESLGIAESAIRMAREYAAERVSMGKTIDKHEMIADYLDEMEVDIQGIRALAMAGAYHEEMWQKINLKLTYMPPDDEDELKKLERKRKKHQYLSRNVTPLIKYMGAEKTVEITRKALQIHGGYGYSSEFLCEKLLRDAMVLPIYEGTSQIQALMAMKDNLTGILKNPKRFFTRNAATTWKSKRSKNPLERRVARLRVVADRTLMHLMAKLAGSKVSEVKSEPMSDWMELMQQWDPKKDFSLAMLHAERLTQILADAEICEQFLAQSEKYPEREEVLVRYLERAEPRCRYLNDQIVSSGSRLMATLED